MKRLYFQLTVSHSIEGVCSFAPVPLWRLPVLVARRHIVPSKARFSMEGISNGGAVRFRWPLHTGRQYQGPRPAFRWVWLARLVFFFAYLGRQNDYGVKSHFWKTRFGVSTAWRLAGILAEPIPETAHRDTQKPAMSAV